MNADDSAGAGDGWPLDVSVVVVTFNNEDIVEQCLAAIERGAQEHSHEIIVVDNASSDGTVDMAASHPRARIVRMDRNLGFSRATNLGIEQAKGRYLALVNSDVFCDAGAIDRLVAAAKANSCCPLVGASLRYPSGRFQISAGRFPSLRGGLWIAFGLHRLPLLSRSGIGLWSNPRLYREPRCVDWVSAAFCLATREAGPLPTDTFMYGEDVEWAHRICARGLEVRVEPAATGVHLVGATAKSHGRGFRQVRRAQFELRWFARRGRAALLAARGFLVLHALVRLLEFAALVPLRPRPALAGLGEYAAQLRCALTETDIRPLS